MNSISFDLDTDTLVGSVVCGTFLLAVFIGWLEYLAAQSSVKAALPLAAELVEIAKQPTVNPKPPATAIQELQHVGTFPVIVNGHVVAMPVYKLSPEIKYTHPLDHQMVIAGYFYMSRTLTHPYYQSPRPN